MISFSSAIALDLVPRYHPCKPLTTTGTRIVTRVCQFKIDQIHQRTNFMWQENQPKGIFMKTFPPEHISEESIYLHPMSRVWHLQRLHENTHRRLVGLLCCGGLDLTSFLPKSNELIFHRKDTSGAPLGCSKSSKRPRFQLHSQN